MPRTSHFLLLTLGAFACAPWNQPEDYYSNWSPPSVVALSVESEGGNLGGAVIAIRGSGFGTDADQIVVQFGDENAEILSITDGKIEVRVPAGPITGGPVGVRVATATGFATAATEYVYDVGSQYEEQVGFVQVNNFWESCLGGLSDRSSPSCAEVAYIGYTGIDGVAEALTFAYPRSHTENIGFFGGTDQGTPTWTIERPGQGNFVFGVDDLHQDIGEVVLENSLWDGDYYCPDLDGQAVYRYGGGDLDADGAALPASSVTVDSFLDGRDCDSDDDGAYDQSELHFCTSIPEDGLADYVYRPDWPVSRNFFAGKKNDYTVPTSIDITAAKVGISDLELTLPESLVFYNEEGFEPVIEGETGAGDMWGAFSTLQGCFDNNGGAEDLEDVALKFSWVPSEVEYVEGERDAAGRCVSGVCDVQTYVRATFTVLSLNWFGGTGYPVRATVVVPDLNAFDPALGDDGRSTLEVPASVLYQLPSVRLPQASGLAGDGLLDSTISDWGYVILTVERVTDYTLASDAGGTVVFSYSTGDFGFFGWDNPTDADGCHDCRDGDNDGWTDADDPECAGGTEETGYGDDVCNDNLDNDGDGQRDEDDPFCLSGDGTEESNCSNTEDDDFDGLQDEADPDCLAGGNEGDTVCSDSADNDEDGWVDLDDPDCLSGDTEEGLGGAACNDGDDNDGDGLEDALDPDCTDGTDEDETPDPLPACVDALDNDGDGWTDSADPDCVAGFDELGLGTSACNDGVDNDADSLPDVADPDCLDAADDDEAEVAVVTGCDDGLDGDGDGWTDAADPDCAGGGEELGFGSTSCNDGTDNDEDLAIDNADPECADAADTDEAP